MLYLVLGREVGRLGMETLFSVSPSLKPQRCLEWRGGGQPAGVRPGIPEHHTALAPSS